MKKALFPGTFDPFTLGHESIVRRSLNIVDEIVIGIAASDEKHTFFPLEKREKMIKELFFNEPRIKVVSYTDLTVDLAQRENTPFIIRGIRSVKDYEYEAILADMNHRLAGIETIVLYTEPELASISSTIVRDLLRRGKDVSIFLPKGMKI